MSEADATNGIDWARPSTGMKVLLADDHALYRDLIVQVLRKAHEDVTVLEARNFAEALQIAMTHDDLSLVMVDLIMPGMDGFAGISALRERLPEVPIVVVSALSKPRHVHQAYNHGANGFVPKTVNSKVLLGALGLVLSGGIYVPPEVLDASGDDPFEAATRAVRVRLTPRQWEVLEILAEGKTNKEIARALNLSEATIKLHVTALFKELGVTNRTQAAVRAAKLDLFRARLADR